MTHRAEPSRIPAPERALPTSAQVAVATAAFGLLADPTRLQLVWLLRHGERTVGELAEEIGARPAAVSQHLARLRLAALVRTRREGTYVHYALTDSHLVTLVGEAVSHAEHATDEA